MVLRLCIFEHLRFFLELLVNQLLSSMEDGIDLELEVLEDPN